MTHPASNLLVAQARQAIRNNVRATALWAAIGGGLMLYFGCQYTGEASGSPLYAKTVLAWVWTLRIGGGAMLAAAALCLTGSALAIAFDAVACLGIVIMFGFTGSVFLVHGDTDGILSLIFAAVFGHSGWRSWQLFMASRTDMPSETPTEFAPPPPEPQGHKAIEALRAVKPPSPPPAPPPPVEPAEGYLAALAREKREKQKE